MKYIFGLLLLLHYQYSSARKNETTAALQTVAYVDPQRYLGQWYEIASFPQRFQKGCRCTQAEYGIRDNGIITVKNSCMKEGKEKVRRARAKITDKKTNAKLSVQFFWPFKGKYWIIDLAEDYSYAVVGHPNRKYLWILSRQKTMTKESYDSIVKRARAKGFNTDLLRQTDQQCGPVK